MIAKMRSPAFPPRRPSAIIRYLVPSILIILCLYWMTKPSTHIPSVYSPASGSGSQLDFEKPGYGGSYPLDSTGGQTSSSTPTYSDEKSGVKEGGQQQKGSEGDAVANKGNAGQSSKSQATASADEPVTTGIHPIDHLIYTAEKDFSDLLTRETHSLADAAAAYRKRRGRHPPPGFDQWHAFATERNAVIVEDFWDQIYHDLEPFWAVPAALMRHEAWRYEMTINIRNGNATAGSDWFWTAIWLDLIKTIEHLLPDMDLALNAMDEPRLVVPWEDINGYMMKARKTQKLIDPKSVVNEFQSLPKPGEGPDKDEEPREKDWEKTKPYWLVARRGCAPDSPARKADAIMDFDHAPQIDASLATPHQYKGYIANYSLSTEFCHQPDLQGLNGIFIDPLSVSATKVLFPMFGGSKLAVNNEILLPAPMYWNEEERFTGGNAHGPEWAQKTDGVIWRGVATGGTNRAHNWRAFQRHRFVSMNNGTKVALAEKDASLEPTKNFALPAQREYGLKAQEAGRLGEWVDTWANVSFIDLMCHPKQEHGRCNYTEPFFSVGNSTKMAEQFAYKYLPDIDGNSFSGRYLGFLRSTSLPVKATLYREWHDSRLVAWKHFVPMDNRYGDYYGIMEYFLGYSGPKSATPGHDAAARKIATDGKEWAERVLRKEDMQVYVLRLLLEYARVSDERREKMGWVADLLGGSDAAAR